ncbi:hypothetical protein CMV_007495 [Castanea mollissima]|uniref:Axial regulator YABBY 4 n=1 Tax=Castanea mollissima TaxID=60419 RepID=A0A8J4RI14_9ROSI|nr:hypothetical protein CMV_007495 [Castanea mollissima]
MSTLSQLFDLSEQIYYVQCGFCTTMLVVSVPCSSLSMVVTVRCGHCTALFSVNMDMMNASLVPFQNLWNCLNHNELVFTRELLLQPKQQDCPDAQKVLDWHSTSMLASSDYEEDDIISVNHIVNKPPEKRQRAPSAYNQFIKEEIKRLKTENPKIGHKEAFSAAAKNWAHFPEIQFKGDGDYSQSEENVTLGSEVTEVHEAGKGFRERKALKKSHMGYDTLV